MPKRCSNVAMLVTNLVSVRFISRMDDISSKVIGGRWLSNCRISLSVFSVFMEV